MSPQKRAKKKSKSKVSLQRVTGMKDILPKDYPYYDKVLRIAETFSQFYGFFKLDTPILEKAELFEKGTGQDTDVVEKEMYTLKTKGGDLLALRPEFTPALARAYVENGMMSLPQPVKLFSFGPLFRHERPQSGRLRQFNQFNLEVFGSKKPMVDVEVIYLCTKILEGLGIRDIVVEINSIGCKECKKIAKKNLVSCLKKKEKFLCFDCQRRLKTNPLRILDCKNENCQQVVMSCPQILDHLCKDCHSHLKIILEFLDELSIPYNLNPYLVRGLDYYTKTVFEIKSKSKEITNQGTLIGGGRYDDLVKQLFKKEVSAFGAAGGVERIIQVIKEKELIVSGPKESEIFLAQLGDLAKIKVLNLLEEFRKANLKINYSLSRDSLSKQLQLANRLGAKYTLILGEREAKNGSIILRDMKDGKQSSLKMAKLIDEVKKKLK
jgi:histidyl-tRNA synthetase